MAIAFAGERLKAYAGFVKIEHTLFSLPLILAGTLLHARRWPDPGLIGLIVLAAAGGRMMAMGLNRIIDAEIDARNPRTAQRELPSGAMSPAEAWAIVASAGLAYAASAAMIAPICLWLAPIPVACFALYPYLKRVTAATHLGLGLTWSLAPVGGWLAASRTLTGFGAVAWLWLFSFLWVTGFDIIYATMDEAFDREAGLHSLPAKTGARTALLIAAVLHAEAFLCLCLLWWAQLRSVWAAMWLLVVAALFVWQHAIAGRNPAFAFFKINGGVGFAVLAFVVAGIRA